MSQYLTYNNINELYSELPVYFNQTIFLLNPIARGLRVPYNIKTKQKSYTFYNRDYDATSEMPNSNGYVERPSDGYTYIENGVRYVDLNDPISALHMFDHLNPIFSLNEDGPLKSRSEMSPFVNDDGSQPNAYYRLVKQPRSVLNERGIEYDVDIDSRFDSSSRADVADLYNKYLH